MRDRSDEPTIATTEVPGAKPRATSPDHPPLTIAAGLTLGRYQLAHVLGAGGMGIVYRAFDPDLDRAVAIKVLRPDRGDDDARSRLTREARAMARVTHRNVVTVYEVSSEADLDFVVMELIEGTTLACWLKDTKPERAAILDAFLEAARGLAAAHAAGVVHRDFKPDNVLRTSAGRILVCDFGLARGADCGPRAERASLAQITEGVGVLGTPCYMAPEQWAGGAITAATDQFALCIALWESLTGERPFAEVSRDAARTGTACWELPPGGRLPRALRRVLARGLDPDPARRWSSIDALLVAIDHTRPRRRAVFAAIAIGGALSVPGIAGEELGAPSLVASHSITAAERCSEPPTSTWITAGITDRAAAQLLDDDHARARQLRARACDGAATQPHTIACFDGVLARLDAVRHAALRTPAIANDLGALLVDPSVCSQPDPPALRATWSDAAITGFAAQLANSPMRAAPRRAAHRTSKRDAVVTARDQVSGKLAGMAVTTAAARGDDGDACARAIERLARGDRRAAAEALAYAAMCGDDRVHADAWLARLDPMVEHARFRVVENTLRRARDAIRRVEQPDLTAALELVRARYAASRGATSVELRHLHAAFELLGRRPRLRVATLERAVAAAKRRDAAAELASQEHWLGVARAHEAHAGHAHDGGHHEHSGHAAHAHDD